MDQVGAITARVNVYGADAGELAAQAVRTAEAFAGKSGRVDSVTLGEANQPGTSGGEGTGPWAAVAVIVVKLNASGTPTA